MTEKEAIDGADGHQTDHRGSGGNRRGHHHHRQPTDTDGQRPPPPPPQPIDDRSLSSSPPPPPPLPLPSQPLSHNNNNNTVGNGVHHQHQQQQHPQLPHGWERICDAQYGVYYIDHINKRTQYERPYETELSKGAAGFGFTLVEIDKGLVVVKSIIPGGPAHLSGEIEPGDILVSVSGVSVDGLQHADIARLFATFTVGDRISLTFARGYQLPVDLNDDDYDILTVELTKGIQGFGFTICDAQLGQKVKKILDVDRSHDLKQGDILMSINSINLSEMSHLEVVEALKQCPVGQSAILMVKRPKLQHRYRQQQHQQQRLPQTPLETNNNTSSRWHTNGSNNQTTTPTDDELMMMSMATTTNHNNNITTTYTPNGYTNNNHNNNSHFYDPNTGDGYYYANHSPIQKSQLLPHPPPPAMTRLSSDDMSLDTTFQSIANNTDNMLATIQMSTTTTGVPTDDHQFDYIQATLNRSDQGFGFRIVGGAEEGRNVAIGSIVIGGVAHRDGRLKASDEIVSINDRNVSGAAHHDVVELMSRTGPTVSILVTRRRYSGTYDVALYRDDQEVGFGFVIISCGDCALIGRIIEGSPAHRSQRLHIRDRIVAVNGSDITALSHPDIVQLIKESGDSLTLRIIPADCYYVELARGHNGYGFSIRGGQEFNGMPLFILRIAPDGPAVGLLGIGDEIIEINGYSAVGLTHAEAVHSISQSGSAVKLKLRRNYAISNTSNNNNSTYNSVNWAPTTTTTNSLPPIPTLPTFME
ncbi:membrane-associated guanylate kinase, WW and PDZ domain-containing protein 2-like [Oppia nitens]|uniref:membrane-associated guanylate kinase, WW and PDZ domain-containing protein 2-like n=1 Tax=Oppia nitens TaxID=1686743 RepID=UPI0023DA8DAC|nr:membrane-associated guanylate kinase, WW and PDZ domain-containing protein 2-like [Oppia nitens]